MSRLPNAAACAFAVDRARIRSHAVAFAQISLFTAVRPSPPTTAGSASIAKLYRPGNGSSTCSLSPRPFTSPTYGEAWTLKASSTGSPAQTIVAGAKPVDEITATWTCRAACPSNGSTTVDFTVSSGTSTLTVASRLRDGEGEEEEEEEEEARWRVQFDHTTPRSVSSLVETVAGP